MKTIFLHGLGQSAQDWRAVTERLDCPAGDLACPELAVLAGGEVTYPRLLDGLARYCDGIDGPFRLCGLSLGAVLALDYAIRHPDRPAALLLAGVQYKVPTRLIDLQNLVFRLLPQRAFAGMGLSKQEVLRLTRSMRTLDLSRGLRRVACPVALVCGEKDAANLKASRQLARLLPQASLHIVPGAGHELNVCAPEALAALLAQQRG